MRRYPLQPLVGVGVVVKDGESVLLIKRAKDPGRGKWTIPGGLVELGEDLRSAAKREIREEVGIEVEIGRLLGVYDYLERVPTGRIRFHYVLIDFLGKIMRNELRPSEEVSQAVWATGKEAQRLDLTDTTRELFSEIDFTPTSSGVT